VAYEIQFVASAKEQLRSFAASDRSRIVDAIEKHLSVAPENETRHRKKLRPNPVAPWELRIGRVRVFYDVEDVSKVTVLAIGTKDRNKLYIGGKEIQL